MSDTRDTPGSPLGAFGGHATTQEPPQTAGTPPGDPGASPRVRVRTPENPLPHSCAQGHRWAGSLTCHCSVCHRSFSGVKHFDRHRRGGVCLDPAEIGLSLLVGRAFDCWGVPEATP